MARVHRVKHERDGMIYHVMTRTAQKAFLFEEAAVKEWIYRKIVWLSSVYFVDLYAVTVMSNHYHIVLAMRKPQPDEAELQRRFEACQAGRPYPKKWDEWRARGWYAKLTDLSEFMKELNETIARYLNMRNQTRGHVWGDRFKSVLIEDGRGLLACMAYVELNGVRAGLCSRPSEYRWCSVGRFHQAGANAAGVKVPNLHGFESLKTVRQQQRGFALFVDHLAERGENKDASFPADLATLTALVEQVEAGGLVDLVKRRTGWIVQSLVLGSKNFCAEMISRFGLQSSLYNGPRPFELGGDLFNGHRRAGPFCRDRAPNL